MDAIHAAGQVPARAVQVEDRRGVAVWVLQPPGVNLLAALAHWQIAFGEFGGRPGKAPPVFTGWAKNPFAFFGFEDRAARSAAGERQTGNEQGAAGNFHRRQDAIKLRQK